MCVCREQSQTRGNAVASLCCCWVFDVGLVCLLYRQPGLLETCALSAVLGVQLGVLLRYSHRALFLH